MILPLRKFRCAIYCRKSSEEGLGQAFNSLDAQRDACLAYIESQRREGWIAVDDRFDDGGFSGGTLDRPALRRLLRDVEAGSIDAIVCYRIDRLSRSLADFTKLVEILDRHSVSLVSITESFNTATSLGRLNLNMVLSFAQYERELAGERIRDKFLASRKRGLWMGGHVPFGLQRAGAEAHRQRGRGRRRPAYLRQRFLQVGSATRLVQELNAAGYRTRRGKPFDKTVLYKLLHNRTYVGEVEHKAHTYQASRRRWLTAPPGTRCTPFLPRTAGAAASHTRGGNARPCSRA